jgi:hypothetical protein
MPKFLSIGHSINNPGAPHQQDGMRHLLLPSCIELTMFTASTTSPHLAACVTITLQ